MIKKLWTKFGWPRHAVDEHSDIWLLWTGKLVTGWGRPAKGGGVNRMMILGRPYLKSFGRWERLRPGKPTTAQVVGSILSHGRDVGEVLAYLLGEIDPPRGWGKSSLSKHQRVLVKRVRSAVLGMTTDALYMVPEKAKTKGAA